MRNRLALLLPLTFVIAVAAAGCGGEDQGSPGSYTPATTPTESESTASSGVGVPFEDVLACLQGEGLDAQDQSSSISGQTIGIDYSGGRTVISFEESEEDADLTATVAEDYGEVVQAGSVVASIDPSADTADTAVIESCISG